MSVAASVVALVTLAAAPDGALATGTTRPANDNFRDAAPIAAATGTITGDNTGATSQNSEPRNCVYLTKTTVWYRFTPTVNGWLTINSRPLYSMELGLFRGSGLSQLSVAACGNELSTGLYLSANTTYHLQVQGRDGAAGPFTLDMAFSSQPTNDHFSSPARLAAPGQASGSTSGATVEAGESTSCDPYTTVNRSVWYEITPSADGWLMVSPRGSAFEATLALYQGSAIGSLQPMACLNVSQEIRVRVVGGVTYRLQLGSSESGHGAFHIATYLQTNTAFGTRTTRASVKTSGADLGLNAFGTALSRDGRFVAFSAGPGHCDRMDPRCNVYRRDVSTGATQLVSVATNGGAGNGFSHSPAISADGRYVAFASTAANLVSGDTNNVDPYGYWEAADIFVRDMQAGTTRRISVTNSGGQLLHAAREPTISADGRYVAFGTTGAFVGADTNGREDVYLHDSATRSLRRVSVSTAGAQGNDHSWRPALSGNGRHVAFASWATNLVSGDTNGWIDTFVRDLQTGQTTRVSVSSTGAQANEGSYYQPALSYDGRFVAFTSYATNLVAEDTNGWTDVFVRDRQLGTTTIASVATDWARARGPSARPTLSDDGRFLAFVSDATNLVPDDTIDNGSDVFVRDLVSNVTYRASLTASGAQMSDWALWPAISGDGRVVAFHTWQSLTRADANGRFDVYLRR